MPLQARCPLPEAANDIAGCEWPIECLLLVCDHRAGQRPKLTVSGRCVPFQSVRPPRLLSELVPLTAVCLPFALWRPIKSSYYVHFLAPYRFLLRAPSSLCLIVCIATCMHPGRLVSRPDRNVFTSHLDLLTTTRS